MTLHEAVALLRRHNEWRRGGDGEMIEPRYLGLAIDIVCDHIDPPREHDDNRCVACNGIHDTLTPCEGD